MRGVLGPLSRGLATYWSVVAQPDLALCPSWNVDKPFFVVTDTSNIAIGASLQQEEDGKRRRGRPVAFFSHSLNAAERTYPVHERELLDIVLALRTWRHILYGSEFEVLCQTVTCFGFAIGWSNYAC
jgi:hypothetical protein